MIVLVFSWWMIFICWVRYSWFANFLSHIMHGKSLTEEWILTCLSRIFFILKAFLHWIHLCSFGSFLTFVDSWTLLMWAFKFDFCFVSKEQTSHLKLISAQDALWELQELANNNLEHQGHTFYLCLFLWSVYFFNPTTSTLQVSHWRALSSWAALLCFFVIHISVKEIPHSEQRQARMGVVSMEEAKLLVISLPLTNSPRFENEKFTDPSVQLKFFVCYPN